jgi:predicted lipoprotein with Yx(FWY)xxD motif
MIRFRLLSLTLLALCTLALAMAQDAPVAVAHDAVLGHYLVDGDGMALYVFTRDEPGVSNCVDQCATNWPPLLVDADPGESLSDVPGAFGTTQRADGGMQLTYNGWPLYRWVRDQAAGDTTGHAVNGVWWIANVEPVVRVVEHPVHGEILVGPDGMTLYLFTRDAGGASTCVGTCLQNWPPLVGGFDEAGVAPTAGDGVTGDLSWKAHDEGFRQVTIDGMPLYYFARDAAPCDAAGHGVNGVWFVVPASAATRDALRH